MGLINSIRGLYGHSFRRKLLLFNLLAVFLTATLLTVFLLNNFRTITNYALAQTKTSTEQSANEFLDRYAQEKATSTWLQLQAVQNNLTILGKTAQKLIDNRAVIRANPTILEFPLFTTELSEQRGALSAAADSRYDALIPPQLAKDPNAKSVLAESALLNLSMDAIYEANANNGIMYYVGDPELPVTRAYPNIHLVDALGDGLDKLFWKDYFAPNVAGWARWYGDAELRKQIPSPITVEPPYADAAGQGLVVTMFYPLWDSQNNRFAGAVGADITLNNIIENVLSFKVARTGFAFLMNGKGEVIAMPEAGFKLFGIDLTETRQGSLVYYRGALSGSSDPEVQKLATTIGANEKGLLKASLRGPNGEPRDELISYASLPPLSNSNYEQDRWKIVLAVPEAEVFESLTATEAAINAERSRQVFISLALVLGFLVVVTAISVQVSGTTTRDLRTLATAAEGISAKNYAVDLRLRSEDEIGQLGHTFQGMAREIRDYTTNLEARVAERTIDLQSANAEITRLNEQLRGENVRLGAELDVARRLQMMVLPPERETQAIVDLDIACFMRPADEVGGDYYDVLQVGDSVYLGIGDVTGHGLPAGIVMLMAQTAFLTLSQSGERDMQQIVSVLNSVLYHNIVRIQEDKNMTLSLLEYHQREFTIVGQHESVLICRTNGQIEIIDTLDLGLPMGLEEDISGFVTARQMRLEPDDVMLLYTDGVTEAENSAHQQFGIPNLAASLARYHDLSASDIRSRVIDDVYTFIGNTRIYDDISLLVIKQR